MLSVSKEYIHFNKYLLSATQRKKLQLLLAVSPSHSILTLAQLVLSLTLQFQINAISTLSNLIAELSLRTKWHVTWHLHVISVRCVARDLHTIAPGPLERTCWRQFAALWGDCKKSRIVPLNAIIIIIIIIIIIWIDLCNESCRLAGRPSCMAKSWTMEITYKLRDHIFHTCHTKSHHWLLPFYTAFT